MRITSGIFGGRNLAVPKTGDIRPTQDRVRQALFSMLMNEVPSCSFLDIFAGSGAVGLEAYSRGASSVTFVEQNPRHIAVIKQNIESLIPSQIRTSGSSSLPQTQIRTSGSSSLPQPFQPSLSCIKADAYRWLATFSGRPFDIAFADPPYALGEEKGYADFLGTLASRNVIRSGGIFAAEMTSAQTPDEVEGWRLVRERKYGKTRLCLWMRT